jgi:large subunit ribosomal protein L24
MKIKKGDLVQVMTGKNRGKQGRVVRVFPETNKVLVEGVNILKKHERANQRNQQGGITEKEYPIAASNVMLFDTKAGKPTRIGKRPTAGGKTERYAKKSGEALA